MRTHFGTPVPPDLAEALREDPKLAKVWLSLPAERQDHLAERVTDAKRFDTRVRRVGEAVRKLREQAGRSTTDELKP